MEEIERDWRDIEEAMDSEEVEINGQRLPLNASAAWSNGVIEQFFRSFAQKKVGCVGGERERGGERGRKERREGDEREGEKGRRECVCERERRK